LLARRAQAQQQRAECHKGQHHAGGICQAAQFLGMAVLAMARKPSTLMASTGTRRA
jgi:hypothetical protein